MTAGIGRRTFLGGAGLAGAGAVAGAAGGAALDHALADGGPTTVERQRARALAAVRPPAGGHQPGIVERPAAHLVFTAYDLTGGRSAGQARDDLGRLLRAWSAAASTLMSGQAAYPADTTAAGLAPSALAVTIGFGASGLRRAGLAARVPDQLEAIPAFPHDQLDPARGDGDLALGVTAEDPVVAATAARQLTRVAAASGVRPRWTQRGFRRSAAAADAPDGTPRNLMGQLDGTDNPSAGTAQFDLAVWAGSASPAWMRGGSYLVARRIRMLLDRWDLMAVSAQEAVIGRRKSTGAPLSAPVAAAETVAPDFTAKAADGAFAIPSNAHVRLSHPDFNGGARMLRRGYSYDDGLDTDGAPDAGLFFLAFQADPRAAFTPIQRRLDASDALSPFIRHTASALFAVPPAAPSGHGGYVGQQLLEGAL